MGKIKETLNAIKAVDKKITEERKRGTSRDKKKIRSLQNEHRGLTKTLSGLHENDGSGPKDKKDHSGDDYKLEQEIAQKKKEDEFVESHTKVPNTNGGGTLAANKH